MVYAQLRGAVLLVKTLDRISRDLHFITALEKSEVGFKIVDMPNADSFTLHIYGSLAERERQLIAIRTKAALTSLKEKLAASPDGQVITRKGKIITRLGKDENFTEAGRSMGRVASAEKRQKSAESFAGMIGPIIADYKASGLSFDAIAEKLNEENLRTRKGGEWHAMTVQRVWKKAA